MHISNRAVPIITSDMSDLAVFAAGIPSFAHASAQKLGETSEHASVTSSFLGNARPESSLTSRRSLAPWKIVSVSGRPFSALPRCVSDGKIGYKLQ